MTTIQSDVMILHTSYEMVEEQLIKRREADDCCTSHILSVESL